MSFGSSKTLKLDNRRNTFISFSILSSVNTPDNLQR